MDSSGISTTHVRVNYSETDQMGVVYHARYIVWLDVARTEHLRQAGMAYRDLEALGFRLAVGDLAIRYRQAARYDDLIRVTTTLKEVRSRTITFEYLIEHADTGARLVSASTTLASINRESKPASLPPDLRRKLENALA